VLKSIAGAIGLVLGFAAPALADNQWGQGYPVIPRESVAFGKTYGDWAAAWWQWALSMPPTNSPLYDTAGCGGGQTGLDGNTGPVFFLGGKYCVAGSSCTPGVVTRACTVPAGKALFFPVVNVEDTVLEEGTNPTPECNPTNASPPPPTTINCLRQAVLDAMDTAANLSLQIDSQSIPNDVLKTYFREQSPVFDFTLPNATNNLFVNGGEGPFTGCSLAPAGVPGTCFIGVDDGVYVMLSPLSAGSHTLHFLGTIQQFNFSLNITYHLTVQ
jgi:hypothetical protein